MAYTTFIVRQFAAKFQSWPLFLSAFDHEIIFYASSKLCGIPALTVSGGSHLTKGIRSPIPPQAGAHFLAPQCPEKIKGSCT